MKYRLLPPEVWSEVRQSYESGRPPTLICREFGIGKSTLMERRRRESWARSPLRVQQMGDCAAADERLRDGAGGGWPGQEGEHAVTELDLLGTAVQPDPGQAAADPPVSLEPARSAEERAITRSHLRLASTLRHRINSLLLEDELGAGTGNRRSRAVLDAATALEKLQRVERVALGMHERDVAPRTNVVILVPPKLTPEEWQRKANGARHREAACDVVE